MNQMTVNKCNELICSSQKNSKYIHSIYLDIRIRGWCTKLLWYEDIYLELVSTDLALHI